MHFHLPKPIHGWREFLGEISIIVIGVLIALGAEQMLENWHWRDKADATTESLRREIGSNYGVAVEAAMVARCVNRQLDVLEAALAKPGFTTAPLFSEGSSQSYIIRTPSRPWNDYSWRAATSEGTVSHLPVTLRENLPELFAQVVILELNARQVDVISWRLQALSLPTAPEQRTRSIEELEELRGHVNYMALVANQLIGRADFIKMRPSANVIDTQINASGTVKFCRAHGLPIGRPAPQAPS